MNFVPLRQIVDDFIVTMDSDDYISNVSDVAIRNIALRGIREFGFDITNKIKSLKRTINTARSSIALPGGFVRLGKLGVVDSDGILRVFGENPNIAAPRKTVVGNSSDFSAGPLNIEANRILNRTDSKSATGGNDGGGDDFDYYVFENYLFQGGIGRLYGLGGGRLAGEYRVNLDQNRIEIDTTDSYTEVVIEYIADEARTSNPQVHVYAEEALRSYIYYKLCERKSTVPANEKARARKEYYNELRKANARLKTFSKDEALKTIRKNYKLAPKY